MVSLLSSPWVSARCDSDIVSSWREPEELVVRVVERFDVIEGSVGVAEDEREVVVVDFLDSENVLG